MGTRSLSRSVEDYLKAIYALSEHGDTASTSAIAEALDIQPASVTGMVKRLAEDGLVEHAPYKGVRLSEPGTIEALRVMRRHRILETYLCERLGYSWDDVHAEAERLEHAASDQLIEQMSRALGSPSHDPHGAPIPTTAGVIEETDLATLADAQPGARLRIRAVRDEHSADLRSMAEEGLVPGTWVTVGPEPTPDGSILVSLDAGSGPKRAVTQELARQIYVVTDAG
ncbi:MAG: metal-dependent transcriptional regulator [Longimicrobiales bacterium]|jgi:DtxR family Mn-dependent transcriptional regulator